MSYENLRIERLDLATAANEADQLLPLMGLVNPSTATTDYLLTSHKGDGTPLYGKWEHSRVLREAGQAVGLSLSYERPADDDNPLYPVSEKHLGILAVAEEKQGKGYGAILLRQFVDEAIIDRGFTLLGGPIEQVGLSVSEDKAGPLKLYKAFGFEIVGTDHRRDETLHVMRASPFDIIKSEKYQQTPVL